MMDTRTLAQRRHDEYLDRLQSLFLTFVWVVPLGIALIAKAL